jgi:hypothetical protein
MRRCGLLVGMLAVVSTMGCGVNLPDTPPSADQSARNDEAMNGQAGEANAQKRCMLELEDWETKYAQQREQNRWPNMLSDGFLEWTSSHPCDADIPPELRDEYRESMREYTSQMAQIVDVRRETVNGTEGIVEWNDSDFARIQAGVYWIECPFTVEIRLAQEDMWAYEAILRVIAKANDEVGATGYDNAAIKRIETLAVGRPALLAMHAASRDESEWSPGGLYDEEYDSEEWTDQEGRDRDEEYDGIDWTDQTRVGKALRTGRYVDLEGEPLAADSLPFAEFNLLPVHMEVVMDQQRLSNLLVHLANSHMSVEVKHLRIDGMKQDTTADATRAASPEADTLDTNDIRAVPVEIVGTMRIYNPPPETL